MTLDAQPWVWQPMLCPADQDFIEWMMEHKREKWFAGTVFHMGPGEHHRVPRACENLGLDCVSITVSEGEVMMMPHFEFYRCILQNIWDLDPKTLPEIHFMTLFHIGEEAWRWGEIEQEKLGALIERVVKGGYVFFYARSSAFDRQLNSILNFSLDRNILRYKYQNRSILVYEKII